MTKTSGGGSHKEETLGKPTLEKKVRIRDSHFLFFGSDLRLLYAFDKLYSVTPHNPSLCKANEHVVAAQSDPY